MVLIGWDFNGYVGEHSAGFEGVHGGNGYDMINQDGLRILDFSLLTLSFKTILTGLLHIQR